jgi:ABC-type transport system involved in cytochrome c biogenesis permease subunit
LTEMKVRKMVSVILVLLGLVILIGNLVSWIVGAHFPLNSTLEMILGVLLLLVGVLIFITEMFESWLSHGQAALVDGLQAG